MGFYSPQSLIADARRHGVTVRGPDVNASGVHAGLEPAAEGAPEQAVRLGLAMVRTVGRPWPPGWSSSGTRTAATAASLTSRAGCGLTTAQAEALATGGAFDELAPQRRQALWSAGAVAAQRPDRLPGTAVGIVAPPLPGMSALELAAADVWATGVSPDSLPTQFLRPTWTNWAWCPLPSCGSATTGSGCWSPVR